MVFWYKLGERGGGGKGSSVIHHTIHTKFVVDRIEKAIENTARMLFITTG